MKKNKEDDIFEFTNCRCTEGEECDCGCTEGKECTCVDCNCEHDSDECSCHDHENVDCHCGCECEDDEEGCGSACCCSNEEKSCCSDEHAKDHRDYNEHINEVEMLQHRLVELDSKAKYAQAELVNYRKRKDEEVSNMLKYANQDLIIEVIPLIDSFERAIKLADTKQDDKLTSFLEGFKMLNANLVDTLKKFGVEEINAEGIEFDPNLHLALLTAKDKTVENGVVLEVLQKGYTLKGKMIRPASVKVNKLD